VSSVLDFLNISLKVITAAAVGLTLGGVRPLALTVIILSERSYNTDAFYNGT